MALKSRTEFYVFADSQKPFITLCGYYHNVIEQQVNFLIRLQHTVYWRSIKFGSLAVGEATVKFKSVKFKCDLRVRVRAYYIYETTAKFKSTNIFISAARDQTAKFKDRQYFRLYGNLHMQWWRFCKGLTQHYSFNHPPTHIVYEGRVGPETKD